MLLHGSGTLVNAAGALINNNFESGSGVFIDGAGLVENAGTIFGNSDGVALFAGGTDETLDITGNLRTANFAFVGDSHGGTDITDNIITTLTTSLATGITLGSGDFLDRLFITQTGAVKTSSRAAIVSGDAAASLVNYGTVSGASYGTSFANGGVVINAATIAGSEAVRIGNASGTLTNSGLVKGSFDGVVLTAGGNVSNTGTITGNGVYAVALGGAGAVTNAGSGLISGALGGVELTDGGFFANTGTTATVKGAGGSAV